MPARLEFRQAGHGLGEAAQETIAGMIAPSPAHFIRNLSAVTAM
jgi:hypothetical protein